MVQFGDDIEITPVGFLSLMRYLSVAGADVYVRDSERPVQRIYKYHVREGKRRKTCVGVSKEYRNASGRGNAGGVLLFDLVHGCHRAFSLRQYSDSDISPH